MKDRTNSKYASHKRKNLATMANTLESTETAKRSDYCCGIHGAARARAGVKHASITLSRRIAKEEIRQAMSGE